MVELPAGWPVSLPLPAGAEPVRDETDGEVLRVAFLCPAEHDLHAFFADGLARAGWSIAGIEHEDADVVVEFEGFGIYGQIEIDGLHAGGSAGAFSVQVVT